MDGVEINLEGDSLATGGGTLDMESGGSGSNTQNNAPTSGNQGGDAKTEGLDLDQFNFNQSSHPIAALFHMLFKGLSIFL